jgi:hypothetical protein
MVTQQQDFQHRNVKFRNNSVFDGLLENTYQPNKQRPGKKTTEEKRKAKVGRRNEKRSLM